MSLNIINQQEITSLSKILIDLVKDEEKLQLKDMKMYLNKTNLSAEQKIKEYSAFSASLFNAKISAGLQSAQQYIIRDAELFQQVKMDTAQIAMVNAQKLIAVQEELIAKEKVQLTKEQILQAKEEIKSIQTKNYLAIAETKVKIDNTVANSLSEVRKNGSEVTSVTRNWTDPTTGVVIDYQHLSFAAVSAINTTDGLMGHQMLQLKNQADTFKDHSKVQVANQIMQLSSSAVADGNTAIAGLLGSHKNLCENIIGVPGIFDTKYTTIG